MENRSEKLNSKIIINCTKLEKEITEEMSKQFGLTMNGYVRSIINSSNIEIKNEGPENYLFQMNKINGNKKKK